MKLYHFNPHDWGATYYVVEKDRKSAIESLIKFLEEKYEAEKRRYKEIFKGVETKDYADSSELKMWKKVNADDPKTYPGKFTIDEHGAGDVVGGEYA